MLWKWAKTWIMAVHPSKAGNPGVNTWEDCSASTVVGPGSELVIDAGQQGADALGIGEVALPSKEHHRLLEIGDLLLEVTARLLGRPAVIEREGVGRREGLGEVGDRRRVLAEVRGAWSTCPGAPWGVCRGSLGQMMCPQSAPHQWPNTGAGEGASLPWGSPTAIRRRVSGVGLDDRCFVLSFSSHRAVVPWGLGGLEIMGGAAEQEDNQEQEDSPGEKRLARDGKQILWPAGGAAQMFARGTGEVVQVDAGPQGP